eukprot:scaffold37464_cov160-Amphora_coffeaeformis.AAC.2
MVGTSFGPGRRRGRQSSVARNFLAAVGQVTSSSYRNNNNNNNNHVVGSNNSRQQQAQGMATPKKPLYTTSRSANAASSTPNTTTSSPSMHSPSSWTASSPARRSSSTRSQQSGKTEPTLDTVESSSLMGSSVANNSLRQTQQPLQRTTIYERPDMANNSKNNNKKSPGTFAPTNTTVRQSPPSTPSGKSRVVTVPESPSTPDASRNIYARPLFPATSPRTTRAAAGEVSDHSSLTTSSSLHHRTGAGAGMMTEIRPTESYLMPTTTPAAVATPTQQTSGTTDPEQRTTTSSITTHSTPQRPTRTGALEAHVQERISASRIHQRQATEDWESVSTNEVGQNYYGQRVAVQLPGYEGKTLGQSIDQGIDLLMGAGRWVQCAGPAMGALTAPRSPGANSKASSGAGGSKSPSSRRLHEANSSVSGASTEVATNRAVDLALKRVHEIEKSRGTEQALHEARQALVRLKDTQYLRPSPPPPDFTVHVSPPNNNSSAVTEKSLGQTSQGRLAFGNAPQIPETKCEAKSILSDSTEEGSGGRSTSSNKISTMQMVPVGRLDQKVHRMARQQQQYVNNEDDGQQSLPNESLPSSIGVEVDSRGVAKSNPALRAVFEQHTLDSLRNQRGNETSIQPAKKASPPPSDHDVMMDPALAAIYNPPPPPPPPPNMPLPPPPQTRNEVRNYSLNRGNIVDSAGTRRTAPHPPIRSPDPIISHGTYVSEDGGDGGDSSVVPTVVHPAHLMTASSHDDSIWSQGFSPPRTTRKTVSGADGLGSPVSTQLPATPEGREPKEKVNSVNPLSRRWPPAPAPPQDLLNDEMANDEVASITHGDQLRDASGVFNLRSSPAWASKKRMQEIQDQSRARPSPRPTSSRISSLQQQLFAKPQNIGKVLDSFVIRKSNQEAFGVPSIDDTSIDLQSVRSAFESAHGSVDRFMAAHEHEHGDDSDDDTASVKSLKEKFEGSTASSQKKESEVSKYRAMFEYKSKLPQKPFERGTGELQEVFSKFQKNSKRPPKPKARRQVSDETPRKNSERVSEEEIDQRVESPRRLSDTERAEQDEQGATPIGPAPTRLTVAERIKAFGGQSSRPPIGKQWNSASRLNGPATTYLKQPPKLHKSREVSAVRQNESSNALRASPATPPTRKPSPRPTPRRFNSNPQVERESSGSSDDMPDMCPFNPRASPPSIEGTKTSARPSVVPFARTHPNGFTPDFEPKGTGARDVVPQPRASPTTIDEARKLLRSSPGPNVRIKEGEKMPRMPPNFIAEARQSLRSSPVSHRAENTSYRSQAQTVMTEESQIESEVAEITATKPTGGNKSIDAPVRELGWFQRAAVEVDGMHQQEDKLTEYRPVTPLTPSRVQERVRMFSTANASINGVRRPVPTPANFHEELREIAKSGPLTPERQRLAFRGWVDHPATERGGPAFGGVDQNADKREPMQYTSTYHTPPSRNAQAIMSHHENPGLEEDRYAPEMEERNWCRPQPRRIEVAPPSRGLIHDYGPVAHQNLGIPLLSGEHSRGFHNGTPSHENELNGMEPPSIQRTSAQDLTTHQQAETPHHDGTRQIHQEDSNKDSAAPMREKTFEKSTGPPGRQSRSPSPSSSEFSDGVTLDMSIAEVSGLTIPTALISRVGGEMSVATVDEEGGDSEESSKVQPGVEAKRSEASSSQTSEALVPLLNKSLRQRPMSDEPSMGDSFFEARAIVANHWSKTSEMGQQKQRNVVKEFKKRREENEDSGGGWDPSRIESSFPVTPSNAGDLFEFESGWEPFSGEQPENDPFQPVTETEGKKTNDLGARSTTPTRSNRGRQTASYINHIYPALHTGSSMPLTPSDSNDCDSPTPNWEPLLAPPSHSPARRMGDIPRTSSSFDAGSEKPPENEAFSSRESSERLNRARLARSGASRAGSEPTELVGLSLADTSVINNTQRPQEGRATSFFGRTHPQSSDPTWEKKSYLSYDPTLPAASPAPQEPRVPSWKPPTAGMALANNAMSQRYGAQHAALLARLRALKEARVRRANAIYARTASVFPRQVEFDDYSLSTKSSTQFGGSHFMESLKVD